MTTERLERPAGRDSVPAFRPIHDIDISLETPAQAERAGRAKPGMVVSYPDSGEIRKVILEPDRVDAIDVFTDGRSVHVLSRSKRLESVSLDRFVEGRRSGGIHVCGELAVTAAAGEDFWLLTPAAMAERLAPGAPTRSPLQHCACRPQDSLVENAQNEDRSSLRRLIESRTRHGTSGSTSLNRA